MYKSGQSYARKDIYRVLGLPDSTGGNWDTGMTRYGDDHYIFCTFGSSRTGHDYKNRFDGPDLVWFGETNSKIGHPSIQRLLSGGKVHIFFRDDNRAPFTYAGVGRPVEIEDSIPVKVRWSFREDDGAHPEFLAEEEAEPELKPEGALMRVTVNKYERDPSARASCMKRWGTKCTVCSFDFAAKYGELGEGFVHVHHLRPLSEIGQEYLLDPIQDLRPVCPNCHAMLHRRRPAISIEALITVMAEQRDMS